MSCYLRKNRLVAVTMPNSGRSTWHAAEVAHSTDRLFRKRHAATSAAAGLLLLARLPIVHEVFTRIVLPTLYGLQQLQDKRVRRLCFCHTRQADSVLQPSLRGA